MDPETLARKAAQEAFQEIVMQAFTLQAAFRKVFFLCDVRGLTIAEAAAVLRMSPAAVKLRLDRAHREISVSSGGGRPGASRYRTGYLKKIAQFLR